MLLEFGLRYTNDFNYNIILNIVLVVADSCNASNVCINICFMYNTYFNTFFTIEYVQIWLLSEVSNMLSCRAVAI